MLLPLTLRVLVVPEHAIASPCGAGTLRRGPLVDLWLWDMLVWGENSSAPIIGELELRCLFCRVGLGIFRRGLPAALIAAFRPAVPLPTNLALELSVGLPTDGDDSTGELMMEELVSGQLGLALLGLRCTGPGDRLNADLTKANRPAANFSDVRLSLSFSFSESSISLLLLGQSASDQMLFVGLVLGVE